MNVGLRVLGRLNLDDKVDVWNIKTSRGHISGNEHLELPFLEPLDGHLSLVLRYVTVHYLHFLFDFFGKNELVSVLLCLREHDCFGVASITDEDVSQGSHPVVIRALDSQVTHLPRRLVLKILREINDLESSSHILSCNISNPHWDCSRKETYLNTLVLGSLYACENSVNIFLEAQLEHDICFVEHNCLKVAEVDVASLDVIEYSTCGTNQDVDARPQLPCLIIDTDTAIDG